MVDINEEHQLITYRLSLLQILFWPKGNLIKQFYKLILNHFLILQVILLNHLHQILQEQNEPKE